MKLISRPLFYVFLLSSLFFSGCFSGSDEKKITDGDKSELRAENLSVGPNGLSKAKVTLKTVHGSIVFSFYPKEAPNTVTRIMHLIEEGFYDGLTFHRVVPNFVVQGGDPQGTGTGGSGKKLKAEFNEIQHVRGTVAMARSQDVNSADSQFYIALSTLPHLDGSYTVFGQVTEGLELLDKIAVGDKILSMTLEL